MSDQPKDTIELDDLPDGDRCKEVAQVTSRCIDLVAGINASPFEAAQISANLTANIVGFFLQTAGAGPAGEVWAISEIIAAKTVEIISGEKFTAIFGSKLNSKLTLEPGIKANRKIIHNQPIQKNEQQKEQV